MSDGLFVMLAAIDIQCLDLSFIVILLILSFLNLLIGVLFSKIL